MKKRYLIQKLSSIIPFFSTFVIAFITMFTLKRNHASKKTWFFFVLTFFISGAAVWLINSVALTQTHPVLNFIVSGFFLATANILFVHYQMASEKVNQVALNANVKTSVIICLITVACSIVIMLFVLLLPSVNIEDTNGSQNTDLAVLTLSDIIGDYDYSASLTNTSYKGSQTNVRGRLDEYDYQECSLSCKAISGVKYIQVTQTEQNQVTLNISSQVEEGNMEIVVIINGEYYCHVPINQDHAVVLENVAGKTIAVKIGAESAKMRISVTREIV